MSVSWHLWDRPAAPRRPLSAGELDPDAPWCPGCGFANYSSGPCEVCGYDDQNVPRPGGDFVVKESGPGHSRLAAWWRRRRQR